MAKAPRSIQICRAYDDIPDDGSCRVLVDRLWPRGVAKSTLKIDLWTKNLAPSTTLRKWFNHQPSRWDEFRRRYFQELDSLHDEVTELVAIARHQPLLLIYAARDQQFNNAVALSQYLQNSLSKIK